MVLHMSLLPNFRKTLPSHMILATLFKMSMETASIARKLAIRAELYEDHMATQMHWGPTEK